MKMAISLFGVFTVNEINKLLDSDIQSELDNVADIYIYIKYLSR